MELVEKLNPSNSVGIITRPEKMTFVGRYNLRRFIFGLSALLERTEFYDDPNSSIDLFCLDATDGLPKVALYITPTPHNDDEEPEPQGIGITGLYDETYPPSEVYRGGEP